MKLPKIEELYFAAVASDFRVFLKQAFKTVYPNKDYMDNWHIDAIVYCLELSLKGRMPRLMINMPPRNLKSFIASVALPALYWHTIQQQRLFVSVILMSWQKHWQGISVVSLKAGGSKCCFHTL